MPTTLLAFPLVLVAFLVAFSALTLLGRLDRGSAGRLRGQVQAESGAITFLFDNESVIDSSWAAKELLASGPKVGSDWSRLSHLLEPRFPGLGEWISELADLGKMERRSKDGTSLLQAEWHDGVARLDILSTGVGEAQGATDPYTAAAQSNELALLRATTEETPFPTWHEDHDGVISWCNRAYMTLVEAGEDGDGTAGWPPARLFDVPRPGKGEDGPIRIAYAPATDSPRAWFEVTRHPFEEGQLCMAVPADNLVKAETTLKEFVSTLSTNFADLPIGLAIFDRNRELTMFNPALVDLTALSASFLVARPSLVSVLDRLREKQMMPEPKDYKSWRQRVSDLVAEARNGTFEETWTLPGGQTYRVTGRPHPDGAVAFLFEDISAEIGLARRFRAEIETGQAALDVMPGAVAVFSTVGVMAMSNAPYRALWLDDPEAEIEEVSIFDAIKTWRAASQPSQVFDDIKAAVGHAGPRESWTEEARLKDGRPLLCRVASLPHGFTLVEFTPQAADDSRAPHDGKREAQHLLGAG